MEFEWDTDKAVSNHSKHGVSFVEENHDSRVSAFRREAGCWLLPILSARAAFESSALGKRLRKSGDSMSQQPSPDADDDMLAEYDFSRGVRGKHHQAYKAGTNVVFLDPDVASAFPDSASVNQTLRLLVRLAKENVPARRPNNRVRRTRPARAAKSRR